jgi:hypothetical protein
LNGSGTPAARGSRLGAVGLIGLLVAALILGLFVYRERTPDLALEVTKFPKEFSAPAAEIEFFVRFDSEAATVEMVGRDQVVARTLADSIRLEAEQPLSCLWDGLDDDGHPVEPGRYRLRVTLPEEDREMVFPRRLNVRVDGEAFGRPAPTSDPCEDPVAR